jgi:hypothetical protein
MEMFASKPTESPQRLYMIKNMNHKKWYMQEEKKVAGHGKIVGTGSSLARL